MSKTSPVFVRLAYLYVTFPVFIFILGWCNLPTAVLGGLVVPISLYLACKNAPDLWFPSTRQQKHFLITVLLISLAWVYLSGIGALVFQNMDHNTRNPLFEMMVQHPWPVILDNPSVILTYYIGFWLPGALAGKMLHSIAVGYYTQVAWGTLGVFLFFYLTLSTLKHKNYWPVLVFILFSGLDAVGCLATGHSDLLLSPIEHLEWWYYPYFQFSSFTTQLFWVFNQAIPLWVVTMLMYHERNNKSLVFLYACTFLHSTLPALGLFPFVVYWCIKNGKGYTYLKPALRHFRQVFCNALTFQNLAGGFGIMLICAAYLSGNMAGSVNGIATQAFKETHLFHWFICFLMPEVGLYFCLIWHRQKRNVLFYLSLVCFIIYPFIQVGLGPDFCLRATLPALVFLYIMVVQTLENAYLRRIHHCAFAGLILVLVIGSITPLHEFTRTIYFTRQGITKISPDLFLHNFFGWKDGNLFLKYFGKNSKN